MKKLNLLFAGAFAALAIVACSDDELETETKTETDTETDEGNTGDENTGDEEETPQAYITLSEAELQFARTGGEATVTVETNYDWDCEYESDWFTVVADTGAGTLTVTCELNTTGKVREGTVTVTAGDNSNNVTGATLKITQEDFEAAALVLEYTINEDGTEIQLPLGEKDVYENVFSIDCTVDWGDGSEEQTVNSSWPSHTYSAGTYNVIINGMVELLSSYYYDGGQEYLIGGGECLTAVRQWGDTGLKSMNCAFFCCTNLASLPEGAGPFSKVTSFLFAFSYCEALITIPEDMFSGCTAVENFGYAFADCTSLTAVPENLFANCPSVKSFEGVLGECTSLETVPVGIFDNNKSVEWFEYAFYDCPKLEGESPYTVIEGNNVHLYERENYPEYFTAPTSYGYCFTDCTGLDDYYSIPSSWGGGGSSPTSVTPQSLNATDREEFSPSHLGPQRAATGPHRDAATPQGPAARPLPTRK